MCDTRTTGRATGLRKLGLATLLLGSLSFIAHGANAEADGNPILTGGESNDLPAYNFPYRNGLYATLAGYLSIKDIELKQQKSFKLKIDGFKTRVPVRAVIQPRPAPLVVVLLGVDGEAKGKLGKLWPSWLAESGCHVLTFDSTFLASFIEISGHGVTGNLVAETERVRDIISAFLNQAEIRGKVTKLGIAGMSYGGIQALLLGQMANEGKLPFKIDAIQSYCPPIRLQKTGELIDKWYREDRWQYTLVGLAEEITGHKPVGPNDPVPFDDSLMRAGIAAVFRLGLVDVIVRNDRAYKMNALPKGNNFDDEYVKRDYAATWGYGRFMRELSYEYWKDRMNYHDIADLTRPIQLENLLQKQPPYSETIIAEDDPFNEASDTSDIISKFRGNGLTVLPHGGHLGFVNDPWTKAKLLSLFKTTGSRQASLDSPSSTKEK
ncbi:MAG TPA: alpha/beta fold hydrolase [Planctomycetota bacterium]|nr:alpha/beta fold hydrolase [Planctomycetota bacterium]